MLEQYEIGQHQLYSHPTDVFPIYFPSCLLKHRRLYIYSENLEKVHLLKKEEKHWTSSISESAKEFGWDYEKILMESENTS
jgi:hypothetical protein